MLTYLLYSLNGTRITSKNSSCGFQSIQIYLLPFLFSYWNKRYISNDILTDIFRLFLVSCIECWLFDIVALVIHFSWTTYLKSCLLSNSAFFMFHKICKWKKWANWFELANQIVLGRTDGERKRNDNNWNWNALFILFNYFSLFYLIIDLNCFIPCNCCCCNLALDIRQRG